MNNLYALAFRYLKYNKRRTVTTVVGVMLSTILIYVVFSSGYCAYESFYRTQYENDLAWEMSFCCDIDTAKDIVALASSDKGEEYNELGIDKVFYVGETGYFVNYINDFEAMTKQFDLVAGRVPNKANELLVSNTSAIWQHINVGMTIQVCINDSDEEILYAGENDGEDENSFEDKSIYVDWVVTGIYKDDDSDSSSFSIKSKKYVHSDTPGIVNPEDDITVFLNFTDKDNLNNQMAKLASYYEIERYNTNKNAIDYFSVNYDNSSVNFLCLKAILLVLATVGAIAGLIIVRNAFNISVHERGNDYGILRCIGLERKQIIKIIIIESFVVAIIGITVGLLIGHGITFYIFRLSDMLLDSLALKASIYPDAIVLTVGYALIMTGYAMVAPIEKLYRLSPVQAMEKSCAYKLDKIKIKRGTLLNKLFGFEVGYAYKGLLRRKGRFLLNVVTLCVCVTVFIFFSTTINNATRLLEDIYLGSDVDGFFSVSSIKDVEYLNEKIRDVSFIKSVCWDNEQYVKKEKKIEDGVVESNDIFLGLDSDTFDMLCERSGISKSQTESDVIDLLVVNSSNLPENLSSDTILLKGEDKDIYMRIIGEIEDNALFKKALNMHGFSNPRHDNWYMDEKYYIYEITDTFDGFDSMERYLYSGQNSEYMFMPGDFHYKVTLKDSYDKNALVKFVEDTGYLYCPSNDELQIARRGFNVIKFIAVTLLFIVFAIILTNAINLNHSDKLVRQEEFEILSYIGLSNAQKRKILFFETFIVVIIAFVFGCILGNLISSFVLNNIFRTVDDIFKYMIDIGSIGITGLVLLLFCMIVLWV